MAAGEDSMSDLPVSAVTFRKLKLFEAAGRLGSVSRAASECGLTQPAATQSLALLARKVGVPLLESRATGTTLTPLGRELHARARSILEKLDRGLQRLDVANPDEVAWRLTHTQLQLLEAIRERGSLEQALVVTELVSRSARRALKALGELVGYDLIARESGSTVLSAAGATLARDIGLLGNELGWIVRDTRERAGQAARTVVVGVAPDPGTASLDAIVRSFAGRHPIWCIEVVEAGQLDLLKRLAIGEIDVVVGHDLGDPGVGLVWNVIARASYQVVSRRGHRLAGKAAVGIRDLAGETWVLGARGTQRRAASDALFLSRSPPSCALVTSAAPMMAHLLADSDFLGLMTERELRARQDKLVVIAHDSPPTFAKIGLATRNEWQPSETHRDVIQLIREQLAES